MVHGYHELHNSWPFHNGAAPGLRVSRRNEFFSVCRREDYFSSYSFTSRSFLSLPLSLSLPSLSRPFSPPRSVSFRGFVPCAAFIKLLFYEALGDVGWGGGRRQGGGGRRGVRTHLETHFEWTAREAEINSFPARLAGRLDEFEEFRERELFDARLTASRCPRLARRVRVGVYEFILKGIPATINVGSSNNLSADWLFARSRLGI